MKNNFILCKILKHEFLKVIIFFIFATVLPTNASASYFATLNAQKTGPINVVSIDLKDQITDGCWTNAESAKNAVKVFLTRSGFSVGDDSWNAMLTISAIGFRLKKSGICVGALEVNLEAGVHVEDGVIFYSIFSDQFLASNGSDNLNVQFINFIRESLDRMYLGLDKNNLIPH